MKFPSRLKSASRPSFPSRRRRYTRLQIIPVAIIVVIGLAYTTYRLGLRAPATTGATQTFRVATGENAPLIARHLAAQGLIRNRTAFVTYINLHGLRPRLKVGAYSLAPTMSGQTVAELLADGHTASHRLLIPEGYRLSQITAAVGAAGLDKTAFTAALKAPHSQAFLSGKPADVDLEGYLFPDSYQITGDTTPAQLVDAMLNTFGKRVGTEYVQAFAAEGLSLHQGLTLASIVEREVSIPADRPIVAQIFLKRLKTGMPLGSDVTAQYASDLLGVPFSVDVNSPYNTRRFPGLPPGPICSPGLTALDAVAHPATTDYLFFLSGKDGKTYYAKTLAEHNQNIAKYLN